MDTLISTLRQQIAELEKLVSLKDKRIAELEKSIPTWKINPPFDTVYPPYAPPWQGPFRIEAHCAHQYPLGGWGSTTPPSCMKCGKPLQSYTVTSNQGAGGSASSVSLCGFQGKIS